KVNDLIARSAESAARESELRAASAESELRLRDELRQHDADARDREARLASERATLEENADAELQRSERLVETLRREASTSGERLEAARIRLEEVESTVDDLRGKLAASEGRVSELASSLEASREESELRARSGSIAKKIAVERLGRAAASAKAAAREAERERNEGQEALQAANDWCKALEQELGQEHENAAELRRAVAELEEQLRGAVETGAQAAADAEDRIQAAHIERAEA
ncbi:unnamed protein product, partial [Scytosiphon promiscuus]